MNDCSWVCGFLLPLLFVMSMRQVEKAVRQYELQSQLHATNSYYSSLSLLTKIKSAWICNYSRPSFPVPSKIGTCIWIKLSSCEMEMVLVGCEKVSALHYLPLFLLPRKHETGALEAGLCDLLRQLRSAVVL